MWGVRTTVFWPLFWWSLSMVWNVIAQSGPSIITIQCWLMLPSFASRRALYHNKTHDQKYQKFEQHAPWMELRVFVEIFDIRRLTTSSKRIFAWSMTKKKPTWRRTALSRRVCAKAWCQLDRNSRNAPTKSLKSGKNADKSDCCHSKTAGHWQ